MEVESVSESMCIATGAFGGIASGLLAVSLFILLVFIASKL